MAQKIKEMSSLKYGRDREEVDQKITERWRLSQMSSSPSVVNSDMPAK
jgi:hypothetical protein